MSTPSATAVTGVPVCGNRALLPFGTSIFSEMTALANQHDAINLAQGFPDFDGPDVIKNAAADAVRRGPNQYIPSTGLPPFREAVAGKLQRFYGVTVDPESEITVTAGATEGLCATLLGLLNPGDEVLLLDPSYDSYAPVAALAGATVRRVALRGNEFALPRAELAAAVTPRTRALVVNNPQNPCGKVYTADELGFLARLCRQADAWLIGDEVYEHLVYEGRRHVSLLSLPELRDRAVVVSSTAKTFSMTGWKVGYVVAAPPLTAAVRRSHQFLTFCGQHAFQQAMTLALALPDAYYATLKERYAQKRDLFCDGLRRLGFRVIPPAGTYYVLADLTPLGLGDDVEFCRRLPAEAGVAALPCSVFWEDRRAGRELVRFCFCKRDSVLTEALARLQRRFA